MIEPWYRAPGEPAARSASALALRQQVPRPTVPRARPAWAISIVCLGGGAYAVLFVVAIVVRRTPTCSKRSTVAPILILLTVPLALRIARTRGAIATLAAIVMAGCRRQAARRAGALLRRVRRLQRRHRRDAVRRRRPGRFAPDFRRGIFDVEVGRGRRAPASRASSPASCTRSSARRRLGGFLVFAWIGFLGLLLFWRAFRIGVPDGDGRRYMILVLFLPSLLYWPSAIGKEAWMMLGLGLCAYGIACVFQRRAERCARARRSGSSRSA